MTSGRALPVPYTGKSEYCYSNSLHMVLSANPVTGWSIPSPGRLECLSTMPFGELFLKGPRGLEFFLSPANTNPDLAVDLALDALGWTCQTFIGSSDTTPREALRRLQSATEHGPALVGPLNLGGLVQNPRAKYLRGGDHFVVAYAVDQEGVTFNDPFGFPHTWIPAPAFLRAWNVGRRGYWRGPFTVRWNFRPAKPATPRQAIRRTMPRVREALLADPGGPVAFGSLAALDQLRDQARKGLPPELRETLVYFSLPLGARRRLDAADFADDAGRSSLADLFREQSQVLGRSQFAAVSHRDREFARYVEQFRGVEEQVITSLR